MYAIIITAIAVHFVAIAYVADVRSRITVYQPEIKAAELEETVTEIITSS